METFSGKGPAIRWERAFQPKGRTRAKALRWGKKEACMLQCSRGGGGDKEEAAPSESSLLPLPPSLLRSVSVFV